MRCTFFGHSDTTDDINNILEKVITDLIENHNTDVFYVGNQGNYDSIVKSVLKKMKQKYEHITCLNVLAYMPDKNQNDEYDLQETVLPNGIESVPPKFAIDKRNRWMIKKSDYVVCYVKRSVGGAAKFKTLAEKKGKAVLNIVEM